MSFFSNLFQSTIGKVITIAAATAAIVFTGGTAAALFGLETAAGGFVAASLGLTGAAAAAVGLAGSLVAAAIVTSALFGRSPTDPIAGTNQDLASILQGTRQLSSANTGNSLPWVVGNAYLSGQIFDTVLSTDQQTIWYAFAISEVGSNQTFSFDLTKIYWGDKQIIFDSFDQTKVAYLMDNTGAQDSKVAGYIYMYFFTNGSSSGQNTSQTAIQIMSDTAIPSANRWPSTNVMSNCAFAIVKLIYNQASGVTGLVIPKFRLTSNSAYQKPGTIWYEYMTNNRFGLGVPIANVDQASANAWDAYADQLITYTPAGGGTAVSQPRYRFNGVIDTKQRFRGILDTMMANGDAFFRFDEISNKWQVIPNMPSTSVFSFSDDNIIGAFNFSPKTLRDTYTGAVISFPDASIRDQQNNVYLDVPASLQKPNVPPNVINLTYSLTTDSVQAQYLANRLLEQSQEDLIISFNASFNAAGIQAGDVVDVTNTTYGWAAKLFRVAEVREQTDDTLGLYVNVLCVEYNAQVYDNFNITQFTPAPNTNLPDPTFFGALVAPTVLNTNPSATIPNFQINCTIPLTGIAREVQLYYNTTNSVTGATYLQSQFVASGVAYDPNSQVTFLVTTLPQNNYYFFYKVCNQIACSQFSPSASNMWMPQPTVSTSGVSINPDWSPPVILVPANSDNTPITTGQTLRLGLYGGTALIPFSNVNTDAGMANNSWRIDTTILTTGITLSGPVATATYATWTLTNITVSAGTFTVGLRYKDNNGVVTAVGNTIISITEVIAGGGGNTAYLNFSTFYFNQNPDGTYPTNSQNIIFSIYSSTGTISKTQPVSLNTMGNIVYGTPSGDAGITIVTTGAGTQVGMIVFTQTSTGITSTANILVNTLGYVSKAITVYIRSATRSPETLPATPTGGTFDTFTQQVSIPPAGWSITPPSGTNVLYQSSITLNYKYNTGLVPLTGWDTPKQSTQTLVNGAQYVYSGGGSFYIANKKTLIEYQRPSSGTPSTPTGGSYQFSADFFQNDIGWSFNPPIGSYNPLWKAEQILSTISDIDFYNLVWSPTSITQQAVQVGQIANTFITRSGSQPAIVPSPSATEIYTVYARNIPSFGDAVVVQYTTGPTYVSFTYNGTAWIQAASFIKGDQVVQGTITAQQIAAQTIVGNLIAANTIDATKLNVNQLSAITANMGTLTAGSIQVGNNPAISGTTMVGYGAELNAGGTGDFALGNATNNIVFPGGNAGAITINGRLIVAGNIVAKTITANECNIDGSTIIGAIGSGQLQVGTINSGQVTNTVGPVTYGSNTSFAQFQAQYLNQTFYFQWSSRPPGFTNVTFTINLTIVNNFAGSNNLAIYPANYITTGGIISIPINGNSTLTTTASYLYPSNPGNFYFQSGALGQNLLVTVNTVSVAFNGVTNPSPKNKQIVIYPAFNTYP